ncbi:MAG: hypothetical protein OXR62_11520 [Ahrensia sp.]|nr:hypothetical protein [Ahrensia sp.]
MKTMTEEQAFQAMIRYLEMNFERVPSMEVRQVLADAHGLDYGSTQDPAAFKEWRECVEAVLERRVEAAE